MTSESEIILRGCQKQQSSGNEVGNKVTVSMEITLLVVWGLAGYLRYHDNTIIQQYLYVLFSFWRTSRTSPYPTRGSRTFERLFSFVPRQYGARYLKDKYCCVCARKALLSMLLFGFGYHQAVRLGFRSIDKTIEPQLSWMLPRHFRRILMADPT